MIRIIVLSVLLLGCAGRDGINGTNGADGINGVDGTNGIEYIEKECDPIYIEAQKGISCELKNNVLKCKKHRHKH